MIDNYDKLSRILIGTTLTALVLRNDVHTITINIT
jgi:hypothetical protein